MVHNNKRYSEEFKKQIVNLHLSGKSVKALANEYGLVEQTIYKWYIILNQCQNENQWGSIAVIKKIEYSTLLFVLYIGCY